MKNIDEPQNDDIPEIPWEENYINTARNYPHVPGGYAEAAKANIAQMAQYEKEKTENLLLTESPASAPASGN